MNECGTGQASIESDPFTPIAPTSEVTSFRLGKVTDESIELNWRQPAEVGAAGIDGYIIEQQTLPGKMGMAVAEDAQESLWKPAHDDMISKHTIRINLDALDTGKNYFFRICTQNAAGRSQWVTVTRGFNFFFFCLFLGFDLSLILLFTVGPICCAEKIEEPKINLPRQLNKRIKVPVNDKIHLSVPFQGDKPINTKPHHV